MHLPTSHSPTSHSFRPHRLPSRRALVPLALALGLAACGSTAGNDFNGDGLTDLAIGIPFKEAGLVSDAGAVQVLYGSGDSRALGASGNWLIQRRAPGQEPGPHVLKEPARDGDRLGSSLASADFDNDGFGDLAIGVPSENIKGLRDAGAVAVLYGSALGLSTKGSDLWFQDKQAIKGKARSYDLFGFAVAAGNFDGDLHDDLAIGVPLHDVEGLENGGAVNVIYGGIGGLGEEHNQIITQRSLDMEIFSTDNRFGTTLATGDFNGDGLDDLAVGAPHESSRLQKEIGGVNIVYGSANGLAGGKSQTWTQANRFIMGGDLENTGDRFGSALAAGDFNGDGLDDLAIGTPLDDWGDAVDSGSVNVLYGTRREGLSDDGDQIWHQNSRGLGLAIGPRHNFGAALTSGDFNNDGFADLAVGIPGYELADGERAGAVSIIFGSTEGLRGQGAQFWARGVKGFGGGPSANDEFGIRLASADADNDGIDDVLIAARNGDASSAGALLVLFGADGGPRSDRFEIWTGGSKGLAAGEANGDFFGAALTGINGAGINGAGPTE